MNLTHWVENLTVGKFDITGCVKESYYMKIRFNENFLVKTSSSANNNRLPSFIAFKREAYV